MPGSGGLAAEEPGAEEEDDAARCRSCQARSNSWNTLAAICTRAGVGAVADAARDGEAEGAAVAREEGSAAGKSAAAGAAAVEMPAVAMGSWNSWDAVVDTAVAVGAAAVASGSAAAATVAPCVCEGMAKKAAAGEAAAACWNDAEGRREIVAV